MTLQQGPHISTRRWFRVAIASVVFVSGLGVSELLTWKLSGILADEARQDAEQLGNQVSHNLSSHIQNLMLLSSGISTYIKLTAGHSDLQQLEAMLASTYKEGEFLRNIGLSPGNRITHIYPLQGNEAAIGLYYPNLPRQWPTIKRVMERKEPAMVGPIPLLQGGNGLIYYNPVFLPDGTYWGVISIVLDADRFLNDIIRREGLTNEGVALRQKPENTGTREIVWGDPFTFSSSAVLFDVTAPGTAWQLAISPAPPDPVALENMRFEGAGVSLLLGLLTLALLKAQARQVESYNRLVSISSRIPGAAFQLFGRGNGSVHFSYLSHGVRELYGVDAKDAYRNPELIFSCLVPEDQARIRTDMLRAAETMSRWQAIYRVELSGQALHWHEFNASPTRSGGDICWHGHIADVTERKQAEIEYTTILGTTRDGYLLCDSEGRFLEVNDAYCKLTGYSREQLLEMSIADVEARSTVEGVREEIAGVMKDGYAHFDTRHRCLDGRIIDIEVSVSTLAESDDHMVVFIRDISERKQQESLLRDGENRFRSMANSAPVLIWQAGLDGQYVWFNQVWFDFTGKSMEQESGAGWMEGIHSKDRARVMETYMNHFARYEPFAMDYRFRRYDGAYRWIRNNGVPRFDADGVSFLGYIGSCIDVTDYRDALETRSLFLANMSHEIRTPLNAVLGFLQLLQQTELSQRQADYADKARIAAESLLNILNDILNFSKIESGRLELEKIPFKLDDGLRNLSLILVSSSKNKDLDILFDVSPTIPETLLGDPLRLHQVLLNISSNAVKFTEKGEVVIAFKDIISSEEDVIIEFSVTDTGIGISEEKLSDIFEGFTQAESSTTRHYGGTGLGLAISQRLVHLMGGELIVSSQLGQGSCFTFTLAFSRAPAEQHDNSFADARKNLRILVVDDNPHGISSFEKLAERIGWEVDSADSGQAALDLVSTLSQGDAAYHAIFIDRKMSPMDGWATIRGIRRICRDQPIPLILMDSQQTYEPLLADVVPDTDRPDAFLIKPATGSMLQDAYAEASSGNPHVDRRVATKRKNEQLAGFTFLLVEDNPFNQQVASELLTRSGADVHIANNGLEGVERALSVVHPYDVILMDVQMPVMDGHEATRRIKAERPEQIIIAMTANAFQSDKDACLAAGMNAYIGKPFTVDAMLRVIIETRDACLSQAVGIPDRDDDLVAVLMNEDDSPVSVTEPPASPVVFDMEAALEILDHDSRLLKELLDTFWENYPDQRDAMGTAIAENDTLRAKDVAHTIKGNTGYFGARELREMAAQMEILCKENQLEEARAYLASFDEAVEQFRHPASLYQLNR